MTHPAHAPTERETEILKILWDLAEADPHGPGASVREVFDVMRAREDIAQNTVQTFLRMMEEKGLVSHTVAGRSFIYRPVYSRQNSVCRFVSRVFDGAVDQLVMSAIAVRPPSPEQLAAIEKIIADEKARQAKA